MRRGVRTRDELPPPQTLLVPTFLYACTTWCFVQGAYLMPLSMCTRIYMKILQILSRRTLSDSSVNVGISTN
jgi:hypothetical protein